MLTFCVKILVCKHYFRKGKDTDLEPDPGALLTNGSGSGSWWPKKIRIRIPNTACSKVDIERPEFEAEAYRVFLFRELVMRENLRVTTVQVPLDRHKSLQTFKNHFLGKIRSSLLLNKFLVIHFAVYVVNRFVRC